LTANFNSEVLGLKDALKQINQLNPQYRRMITKEFKNVAEPVVKEAQNANIEEMALSGMQYNWTTRSGYKMFPLNFTRLQKFVVAGTSGKKPKEFMGRMQNTSVFFIRWKSPQATLIEMAAKGDLGRQMQIKNGPPGRVLWRAWEQQEAEVMRNVEQLVAKVMKAAQKKVYE
jgi:hypothetical protein